MQVMKRTALAAAVMGLALVAAADPKPEAAAQASTVVAQPAEAPAPTQAAKATAAPTGENKKICRRYKSTGSRLADRTVCKTSAEWRDDNIAIRKQMNDHNRQTTNGG